MGSIKGVGDFLSIRSYVEHTQIGTPVWIWVSIIVTQEVFKKNNNCESKLIILARN